MSMTGICTKCGGNVSFVFHYSPYRMPMAPTCAKCRAIPQKNKYAEERILLNKSYEDRVLKAIRKLTVSNGNGRASLDGIRLLSGLTTDVARAVCLRLHREGIIRGQMVDGLVLPKRKEEESDELFG